MRILTSRFAVRARSIGRRLGLNKLLSSLVAGRRYEDRFGCAITSEIRSGDTVWDVGANVGIYTSRFVEAAGRQGKVVAFEPTERCYQTLEHKFRSAPTVVLRNVALGNADGKISMEIDVDPLAATHRIVSGTPANGLVEVCIRSSASLIMDEPSLFPNVIKIDVEGHEGEVLDGIVPLLNDSRLRCIGIEVHFSLLEAQHRAMRPREMENTLIHHGFGVRWTDPSHMLARR